MEQIENRTRGVARNDNKTSTKPFLFSRQEFRIVIVEDLQIVYGLSLTYIGNFLGFFKQNVQVCGIILSAFTFRSHQSASMALPLLKQIEPKTRLNFGSFNMNQWFSVVRCTNAFVIVAVVKSLRSSR